MQENPFIITADNRYSCKAINLLFENDSSHNPPPVFVYGDHGVGKSHLLHFAINKKRKKTPSLLHISGADFISECTSTVMEGSTRDFEEKLQSCDIFILDGFEELDNKERAQSLLARTLESLLRINKTFIITSTKPLSKYPNLIKSLKSILKSGVEIKISSPSKKLQEEILKQFFKVENVEIPLDLLSFIIKCNKGNLQELKGLANRVLLLKQSDSLLTLDIVKNSSLFKP